MLRRRVMPDTDYIQFADAAIASICANAWGGGLQLTYTQALTVTDLSTNFRDNSSISSFDELKYFSSLQTVGYAAFRSCTKLTAITLPDSITSLSDYAFYRCSSLPSIDLNNVVTIGQHALRNCNSLQYVNAPNLITIGASGIRETNLKTLNAPNLSSIGEYAFYMSKMVDFTLPEAVTEIPYRAISNCYQLKTLDIAATSIADGFCERCTALSTIILKSNIVPTASATYFLLQLPSTCKIYVQDSLVDAYKSTSPWSNYSSQIYPLSEYSED